MKREYDFSGGERGRYCGETAGLPASDEKPDWTGPESPLGAFIENEAKKTLDAYRAQPSLVTEHANFEHDTAHGGYAHRQLFELVQNSADALLGARKGKSILIRLTKGFLYCADDGTPIDEDGVVGIMFAHMSSKRNTGAIGRFGIGFKSVLGVTDSPEFYSRRCSFRFDRTRAEERIATVAPAERYPVLRLPEPIDDRREMDTDEELRELMSWATNVVRLPLKTGAHSDLAKQIRDFPPQFLLFVDHVRYLTLEDGEFSQDLILHRQDGELLLDTGNHAARWRLFDTDHALSAEAQADWPLHGNSAPIQWAAPLDRLDLPGQFWAFFPTNTASLVAGILNAPWKTNEDRQNLLPGPYNEELIEAAAKMIARYLPDLATISDPARHLDALPREHQSGDSEQVDRLRKCLFSNLHGRKIVPDQSGDLRIITDIQYPPRELTTDRQEDTAPFERWGAYPNRPMDWLHHRALKRNRLARIDRLLGLRFLTVRVSVSTWLEALVEGQQPENVAEASTAAIQTAALISSEKRSGGRFGDIVLTAAGTLKALDPERLFLPDESLNAGEAAELEACVHPELLSDRDTFSALKKLGLKPPSSESRFRLVAKHLFRIGIGEEPEDDCCRMFWVASRKLPTEAASDLIREHKVWPMKLRVRTRAGNWQPLHAVLLPSEIVSDERSPDATVDTDFHKSDYELLRSLGVTEKPCADRDLSAEPRFASFLSLCRYRYSGQDNLPHSPNLGYLHFRSSQAAGPLEVLSALSDEDNAHYTDALLNLDASLEQWAMRHTGSNWRTYPEMTCESFTTHMLREHGRIRIPGGTAPLKDALGSDPKVPEALHVLLAHPKTDKIKAAFDLAEPMPEFFGEEDPIPLIDVWPGLEEYLPKHRKTCRLVRCQRIVVAGQPRQCIFHASDIYLSETNKPPKDNTEALLDRLGGGNERCELQLVSEELELGLDLQEIEAIRQRKTPREVEERRAAVRQRSTDAERLLAAVGEPALREGLPASLLAVLENDSTALTGVAIAEAAIATWDTEVLSHHKAALDHLDPPMRWAGSERAIRFVRSLGFSAEWAGERSKQRDPFLEVEGPYALPELHDYQRTIVENLRKLLRDEYPNERRGMIGMPTGAGKTRVAVQAVVEAMRHDGFLGGVLWVADRDELCEQAVEAWRQVWSCKGSETARLRISRMWAGQPKPLPTNELHVVVATIQTLNAKLSNQPDEYRFLTDFKLVVFDEAHRSIAPTFTSVMQDIGLTRFQKVDEPFLLGLTATPYRGQDEKETARLVHRYGGRRLDSGAFASDDPEAVIRELQGMGVLAQANHETVEGETFSLDGDELKQVLDERLVLPWLPQSVEGRIARSVERTKRIIEAYEKHIQSDWPTLVFATSVEHAWTVAALLSRKGIQSRAVSGETEPAVRRRAVEAFRRGEIRALVNYGVFREGFDAPKTRAIVVARPVYSPNLYFQMIGRGLRGPLNGGDNRCLVLNVRDNIENFDRKLAFSELDWLWA